MGFSFFVRMKNKAYNGITIYILKEETNMATFGKIVIGIFCIGAIVVVKAGEKTCDILSGVGEKVIHSVKKVVKKD